MAWSARSSSWSAESSGWGVALPMLAVIRTVVALTAMG